jgi:hypothetical protein
VRQVWARARRPRYSWLELVAIAIVAAMVGPIHQDTGWPLWLAGAVIFGCALAVVCVVVFGHVIREVLRG